MSERVKVKEILLETGRRRRRRRGRTEIVLLKQNDFEVKFSIKIFILRGSMS
jgi:hypothetical protein